ncbi:translation initiation factor IF-2-like [Passer montanus]|uniref:translation initiation factor IF-2-like n=1 Tax=Passer montanus TaxID=9160 RepID=UPI00195F8BFB|nr:translation initiation factor IF-2-like [Passer montanus]
MVTSRAPAAAPAPPGTSAPPGRDEGAAPAAERWAAGAAQRRGGRRPMAAPLRSPGSGRDCGGARHRLLPRLSVPVAAAPAPSGTQEAPRRPGEPPGLVSPEGGGGGRAGRALRGRCAAEPGRWARAARGHRPVSPHGHLHPLLEALGGWVRLVCAPTHRSSTLCAAGKGSFSY